MPWPMLVVMVGAVTLLGPSVWRARKSALGPCSAGRFHSSTAQVHESSRDPLVTLRERFALGDMDVVGLRRSEPDHAGARSQDRGPLSEPGGRR